MMYPYEEDRAGKLRDKHKTGKPAEALQADDQIIWLAKELLKDSIYLEAESLAGMLMGSRSEKVNARLRLIIILPNYLPSTGGATTLPQRAQTHDPCFRRRFIICDSPETSPPSW